jgi:FtsH-binding integral membrane protein
MPFLGVMPLVVSSSITVWVMFHEANIHQFDLSTWTMVYAAASLTMAFALTPTTFIALLSGYFWVGKR